VGRWGQAKWFEQTKCRPGGVKENSCASFRKWLTGLLDQKTEIIAILRLAKDLVEFSDEKQVGGLIFKTAGFHRSPIFRS
jgi:hypothetical protein